MSKTPEDIIADYVEKPAQISSHCEADCSVKVPCTGCQFRALISSRTTHVETLSTALTVAAEEGDVRRMKEMIDPYFSSCAGFSLVTKQVDMFYRRCDLIADAHIKTFGLPFYMERLLQKRGIKDVCSLLHELRKGDSLHHSWLGFSLRAHLVRSI